MIMRFLNKYCGSAVITVIIVCFCLVIGVMSVIDMHGDNPLENAANRIINNQLGTSIDISDIMQKIDADK